MIDVPGSPSGHHGDLRSVPTTELAITMLNSSNVPGFDDIVAEMQRRWDVAGKQATLAMSAVGDEAKWDAIKDRYDATAVEEARQYLAIQTLVQELGVLQEAGVEPAAVFRDTTAVQRVREVLTREYDRNETQFGPDGEILAEPEPFGRAASHLAYWSELALFGRGDVLLQDQRRLAGDMLEDVLQGRYTLCRQYLTELRGPWSLTEFLANPAGKQYHQPQPPDSHELRLGLDVALGRPGQLITAADIEAAHADTAAALAAEMERVAHDDPPEPLGDLGPRYATHQARTRLHANMCNTAAFFTAALGVASLAADRTLRVDGRPVPRDNASWVLELHREGVRYLNGYVGTISIAGLRITFEPERDVGAVAVVDAAGVQDRLHPESLAQMLAFIDHPDSLTYLAKMRRGID